MPDGLLEINVGGGDYPNVNLARRRVSERRELALLKYAQKSRLSFGRDVAYLVEEERAAVGDLEQSLLRRDRAGERAARVAEEF